MPWLVLLASAVLEAVWASALGASDGLTRPVPAVVFLVALAASMCGLGWVVKHLSIGTAYAVWVGVGAALTVAYAMTTGAEAVSAGKLVFLAGIVAAVIGLKLLPHGEAEEDGPPPPGALPLTELGEPDEQTRSGLPVLPSQR